ncbi:Dolichyl-phosphate-mannose-protein mannosyltransferase [Candidatus Methanoperedenaceae archaeon GB50]|nr:Dolichyl-phosphate-mannose-protein mannosyltransferase [Candidatus Methanoperedenaceae archaeon GB50]CAD7778500.1 MAG: Dolichyl-phosphate-mannose-protein mannosyltransferase [Candidatus Methanoperedenaceae archaeon GB50]
MKIIRLNKLIICLYPNPKQIFDLLYMLFFVGLIIYFLFYIFNAYQWILYPYQIDFSEGFRLDRARMLSQGYDLYHDISTYPFVTAIYPPVSPLICAALVKIFGVSFATGRLVGMFSAILVGCFIFKIVQEKTKNKHIAVVSSLLFFASPYIYGSSCIFGSPNMLGTLFSWAGIYCILKYENSKKIYLSVPFFLLAIYSLPVFIAAPAASFIYLFIRDKKLATKIIVLYVLSGLFLFSLANYITDGQFYLHTVRYNAQPIVTSLVLKRYIRSIGLHPILFAFAVTYIFSEWIKYEKKVSLVSIYFITAAIFVVSMGHEGAGTPSYMFELLSVSCILFGMMLDKIRPAIVKNDENTVRILIAVLLILQLIIFAHAPYIADSVYSDPLTPTQTDLINGQKVSLYIKEVEGPVLSENSGFLVINGKEVLLEPFVFRRLYNQGLWDQTKLVDDIHNQKFSLIVLRYDVNYEKESSGRLTKEINNEIRDNYYIVDKIGGGIYRGMIHIYKPRR